MDCRSTEQAQPDCCGTCEKAQVCKHWPRISSAAGGRHTGQLAQVIAEICIHYERSAPDA